MENLKIYEAVRSVPQTATKQFSNGSFSGTDINPMWRIKKLTEQFGACGIGWYYEVLSERCEQLDENTLIAIVDLNLYIKVDGEWSKPIYGTGGNKLKYSTLKKGVITSDEGYKMALTDALSVACKALGIGADVYWDKDKTKYTSQQNEQEDVNVPDVVICERCQKPITGVATASARFTASELIAQSKLKYNGCYCFNCMTALKKARSDNGSN